MKLFSEILSHDSLFSFEALDRIFGHLKGLEYEFVNVFTDCGPHFTPKEFIYNAKSIADKYISMFLLTFLVSIMVRVR